MTVGVHSFVMTATERTDWFINPESSIVTSNAWALMFGPESAFTLAARVEVAFATSFDAGALVIWYDERSWAKLAFEYSPQR